MYKSQLANRLRTILDTIFNGNVSKFGKSIGITEGSIRGYIGEKKEKDGSERIVIPSAEVIATIVNNIGINSEWLITGKGSMKKESEDDPGDDGSKKTKTTSTMEDRLLTIIESQQRTIENLSKKGGGIAEDALTAHAKKTS